MTTKTPVRPTVAVLAVVIRDSRLLLVRRANPPDQGLWGYPGGKVEPGEPYLDAALRELAEETGIAADRPELLTVLDFIEHGGDGALAHHYAMITVLCRWVSGEGVAADDALEACWFGMDEIARLGPAASQRVEAIARLAMPRPDAAK